MCLGANRDVWQGAGKVRVVVASAGRGGTVTGVSQAVNKHNTVAVVRIGRGSPDRVRLCSGCVDLVGEDDRRGCVCGDEGLLVVGGNSGSALSGAYWPKSVEKRAAAGQEHPGFRQRKSASMLMLTLNADADDIDGDDNADGEPGEYRQKSKNKKRQSLDIRLGDTNENDIYMPKPASSRKSLRGQSILPQTKAHKPLEIREYLPPLITRSPSRPSR